MGFLTEFLFMRGLNATKKELAKLPPASRQVAVHEFVEQVSMSGLCTSKGLFTAFVSATVQRRQELARIGMSTPEWLGACLAETYLLMRHMGWEGDSKWQGEIAKLEAWIEDINAKD